MALPTVPTINSMVFSKTGAPWVKVASNSTIFPFGSNWSKIGIPFYFISYILLILTIDDSVSTSDNQTSSPTKIIQDTLTAGDVLDKNFIKTLTDSLSPTDAIKFVRDLMIADVFHIDDTFEYLLKVGGVIAKNINDSITVTDSLVSQLKGLPNTCYMLYENKALKIFNGNTEIVRFNQDGSVDIKGILNENAL